MLYIELILLAIGLSIDAFSLAISVALSKNKKYKEIVYSFCVGLFHFFMPILGYLLQLLINKIVYIPNKLLFITAILYIIAGIVVDKEDNKPVINPIIFAFIVSIDSFSIGLSLSYNTLLISCIFFSLTSFIFTYSGFKLGFKIKNIIKEKRKILSITILLIVLVYKLLF